MGKKQQTPESERPGIRLDDDELDIERPDPLDEYEAFAGTDAEKDDRRRDPLRH